MCINVDSNDILFATIWLSYGIEIICPHLRVKDLQEFEKVKSRYLKRVLGVGKKNKNTFVYKLALKRVTKVCASCMWRNVQKSVSNHSTRMQPVQVKMNTSSHCSSNLSYCILSYVNNLSSKLYSIMFQ